MRIAMIVLGFASVLGVAGFFGGTDLTRRRQSAAAKTFLGGTSLLYDIKATPDFVVSATSDRSLAEDAAVAFKRRVDPNGMLHLQFLPVGHAQLEILIPPSAHPGKQSATMKAYTAAGSDYRKTLLDLSQVRTANENLHGEARLTRLKELAGDSETTLARLKNMAELHDRIEQSKAGYAAAARAKDIAARSAAADAQAQAEIEYDAELKEIVDGNLPLETIHDYLNLPNTAPDFARDKKIAELKGRFKDFPARVSAIRDLETAVADYRKYSADVDDISILKRMLRGSGVLEFHIVVTDLNTPEVQAMIERLKTRGPAMQPGDSMKWYVIDNPDEFKGHQTFEMEGDPTKRYVLAYATPDKQLVHTGNANAWSLVSATPTRDSRGGNAVAFEFDAQGAKLFGELTRNNLHQPLGIVLDDRMITAPNLNSEIGAQGQITGGGPAGFDAQQVNYLVNVLAAGILPATLSDEPVSESLIGPQFAAGDLQRQIAQSPEARRTRRFYGLFGGLTGAAIGALAGIGIAVTLGRGKK
jgi:hypothetical protein